MIDTCAIKKKCIRIHLYLISLPYSIKDFLNCC